jgi:hypothetical protein
MTPLAGFHFSGTELTSSYAREPVLVEHFNQISYIEKREAGQLSGIALGYGLDDFGFESRQGLGIFLFTTVSRPALGLTQTPIECIPAALCFKGPRTSTDSLAQPKCLK